MKLIFPFDGPSFLVLCMSHNFLLQTRHFEYCKRIFWEYSRNQILLSSPLHLFLLLWVMIRWVTFLNCIPKVCILCCVAVEVCHVVCRSWCLPVSWQSYLKCLEPRKGKKKKKINTLPIFTDWICVGILLQFLGSLSATLP